MKGGTREQTRREAIIARVLNAAHHAICFPAWFPRTISASQQRCSAANIWWSSGAIQAFGFAVVECYFRHAGEKGKGRSSNFIESMIGPLSYRWILRPGTQTRPTWPGRMSRQALGNQAGTRSRSLTSGWPVCSPRCLGILALCSRENILKQLISTTRILFTDRT